MSFDFERLRKYLRISSVISSIARDIPLEFKIKWFFYIPKKWKCS